MMEDTEPFRPKVELTFDPSNNMLRISIPRYHIEMLTLLDKAIDEEDMEDVRKSVIEWLKEQGL